MFSHNNEYGLLKVSGADAKKLLQGQLTCDVENISPQKSALGALCNPQGRVISLFLLLQRQHDFYLLMLRSMVPITLSALKKYAVFYKTELTDASSSLESLNIKEKFADIQQKLPAIYPETSGKFLPHDLNLQNQNAISFEKGCYTGQEIIARMHYKAKLKNHLYLATINSTLPVLPGAEIFFFDAQNNKRSAGMIADVEIITSQKYFVLLVTDEQNAKNDHLFLDEKEKTFFIFNQHK
jgi:folate-binding protein YgfZ